jgi:hypothetical protein
MADHDRGHQSMFQSEDISHDFDLELANLVYLLLKKINVHRYIRRQAKHLLERIPLGDSLANS